jgi:hypothetical protein
MLTGNSRTVSGHRRQVHYSAIAVIPPAKVLFRYWMEMGGGMEATSG